MKLLLLAGLLAGAASQAHAQATGVVLPQGCGTGAYGNGSHEQTLDPQGRLCVGGGAVSPGGSAATPSFTKPGSATLVPLDVATVTTGGTAVTALTAGHRTAGGFLQNPPGATINLCINEIGTAAGTTSAGSTTCILPGQSYALAASGNAVSVISSDSAHPFAGYGLQ